MSRELRENEKELFRLKNLTEKEHLEEGYSIVNAKVIKVTEKSTIYKYPAQFTKIKEEKDVLLFKDKMQVDEAYVFSIDYLKNTIEISGTSRPKEVTLIQHAEIIPRSILNSLKEQITNPSKIGMDLISRESDVETEDESCVPNYIKTVSKMHSSFLVLQGAPGAGKTYSGKNIIKYLLDQGKTVAITSNSHSAINNLFEAVEHKDLKGAKIYSKDAQKADHKQIENITVSGKEIDGYVTDYNVVGGTCFSLSKIKHRKFDFLIVDEASQLKMAFLLAVSRIAHNVIILGDQNQLQSISCIEEDVGGESVLNYLLQGKKIVPRDMGYFLDVTYRMNPSVATVISDVFYESKLKWNKKKKISGVTLISTEQTTGQRISEIEAKEAVKIYKQLKKKKVPSEEIMIIAPYNAQVSLIKAMIKDKKVSIYTADLSQGLESRYVIISCVSCGNKKESASFSTEHHRLNVSISRAKDGVFLIASKGLQKSKHTSPEFKHVLKLVS